MEEIQAERGKRAERQRGKGGGRGGRRGKGSTKGCPPPPSPTAPTSPTKMKEPGGSSSGGGDEDPLPTCYQFMANGTCNFGEQCRFEHQTADGRKVENPARLLSVRKHDADGRLTTVGAMIMIPFDSRHPPFRGVLGTIVGSRRYPNQLDYVLVASTQLLYNALHVGMVPEVDFVIIPTFERDGLKISRNKYGSGGLEQTRVSGRMLFLTRELTSL